ncbi:hypothetical protein EZV62_020498 [Acer yangbiense]|uniref:F-box domain-containing protein n=1 Tax=Acer yangbiense TaxID=1000413 RepID=A0A5C7HFQ8_9ROSI|nr:hypothetical protein EZV62_020498 [Acer yangbiense]
MKRKISEISTDSIPEEIDWISGLPDHIIHIILSSLSTKDATRTTVLSKIFKSAWDSLPVLDLDSTYSRNWSTVSGKRQFLEYMQGCIHRRANNLGLLKFRLQVDPILLDPVYCAADEAIAYAIVNKPAVFSAVFSAKTVKVLKLNGLDLKSLDHLQPNSILLSTDPVSNKCKINLKACKSLKNLILKRVGLTSECLKANLSMLVLLENLKLDGCDKFEDICITSSSLKTLEIRDLARLKKIAVVAVNLESFVFGTYIIDSEIGMIMVYHDALKGLVLIDCINLREVEFHSQNLTSFRAFLVTPYRELRDLLGFFDHFKTLAIACRSMQCLIFPNDLRECLLPTLYDIKHLRFLG